MYYHLQDNKCNTISKIALKQYIKNYIYNKFRFGNLESFGTMEKRSGCNGVKKDWQYESFTSTQLSLQRMQHGKSYNRRHGGCGVEDSLQYLILYL